jgi:hypothetical protein
LFQAALDADPNYRAAKTATERLKVIFQREDAEKAAAVDRMWKALDPGAPDFARKVDELLRELSNSDADPLKRKVALLRFLAQRDLAPSLVSGFSRVPLEVNGLVSRFLEAPDAGALVPPVCEYLISRFPRDQGARGQCKVFLQVIEAMARMDPAVRQRHWDERWQDAKLDWELALKAAMPDILQLFRLYAQQVKRP